MPQPGRLLLVPAPLDFGCTTQIPLTQVIPNGTLREAARITHWICENAKTARAYLNRINELHPLAVPMQQQQITEVPREVHKKGDHASGFDASPLLHAAMEGHDMGLLSDAGRPAVADPGSSVVRAAHELGIPVIPLVGPVSLLLALAASGLNGQSFAFVGYLPQDAPLRDKRIRELESLAVKTRQTQVFIETPYRNLALWRALVAALGGNTHLAVGSGLTLDNATCRGLRVERWRELPPPVANDTPAVFAIGR